VDYLEGYFCHFKRWRLLIDFGYYAVSNQSQSYVAVKELAPTERRQAYLYETMCTVARFLEFAPKNFVNQHGTAVSYPNSSRGNRDRHVANLYRSAYPHG
jgi:hypothetical protein